MKLIQLNVYQFPLGDCGGITDNLQAIWMEHPQGYQDAKGIDTALIFIEENRGPDYWALVPLDQPEGLCGPMSGGNLAYSTDSRVERVYHIHDRFETWDTYNSLSR